jgi:uncharacterized membrane protein YfcA
MPPIDARGILLLLAAVFLVLAAWRWRRERRLTIQVRTWLIVAAIFTAVAAWL